MSSHIKPATPWTQRGAQYRRRLSKNNSSEYSSNSNWEVPEKVSRPSSAISGKGVNAAQILGNRNNSAKDANEVKNESVVEAKRVPRWRELANRSRKYAMSESGESSTKNAPSGSKSNVGVGKKKGFWKERVQLIKPFLGPPSNSSNFTLPNSLRNNNKKSFSSSATSKISVNGRKATHKYENSESSSGSSYFSSVSELVTNNANKIRNKVGSKVSKLKRANQLPQEGVNEHFEQIKRNLKGNGNHSVNNHKVINNIVNEQLANYKRWLKQPEQKRLQRFGLGFEKKQPARYLQPSLANFHQLQSNFQVIKQTKASIEKLQELRNKIYLQNINEKKMSKAHTAQQAILEELDQMIFNQEALRKKKKKNPVTQIGGAVPGLGVVKSRVKNIEARRVGAGQSSVERNLANRRKVGGPQRQPQEPSIKQKRVANLLEKRALKK